LASITAGGPAPIVALWLLHHFQSSMAIAAYLLGTVVVTLVAASMLPDRSGADLLAEFEEPASPG
ncbi:MAG: MFS transporter, partial [Candidatus Sericytochromatia bacterium]